MTVSRLGFVKNPVLPLFVWEKKVRIFPTRLADVEVGTCKVRASHSVLGAVKFHAAA